MSRKMCGSEIKHFNRLDKVLTLSKRTRRSGNMALRSFPSVQQGGTKVRMRRSMADSLRGSNSLLMGVAEKTEKMTKQPDSVRVCRPGKDTSSQI